MKERRASTLRYTIVDSPMGRVLVAATERGVTSVRLGTSDADLEAGLRSENPGVELVRIARAGPMTPGRLSVWVARLLAHLEGRAARVDVPRDIPETVFEKRVRDVLVTIPYGSTRTYGEVAAAVGQPAAARAVARVCARNPVALVVPCHRVMRCDHRPGKYRWGQRRKHILLEQERAVVLSSERAVLRRFVREADRALPWRDVSPSVASKDTLAPGTILADRYRILRLLGRGGMGVVYLAHDRELDERVALKTLLQTTDAADDAAIGRFKRELRLARNVSDPHVVRAFDIGKTDGTWFYTMEHVSGPSLGETLQAGGQVPTDVAVTIGLQLCRALHAVHERHLVHRDVKPANVLLSQEGDVKLTDFGIAELARPTSRGGAALGVGGTLPYMAPEQLLGKPLDARVDVFAVGVVLYECLTGSVPFESWTPGGHLAQVVSGPASSPSGLNSSIPEGLSETILHALAADGDARPGSIAHLHDALARAWGTPSLTDGRELTERHQLVQEG